MKRGCRAKIPDMSPSETERLPCATMDYTYVDELPKTRIFDVDLSILGARSLPARPRRRRAPPILLKFIRNLLFTNLMLPLSN